MDRSAYFVIWGEFERHTLSPQSFCLRVPYILIVGFVMICTRRCLAEALCHSYQRVYDNVIRVQCFSTLEEDLGAVDHNTGSVITEYIIG